MFVRGKFMRVRSLWKLFALAHAHSLGEHWSGQTKNYKKRYSQLSFSTFSTKGTVWSLQCGRQVGKWQCDS